MYRDLSALLAAKELDLEIGNEKNIELRAEVEALTARVELLEKELADASGPTNRDAVLEGAITRSDDLTRENRHLAEQVNELREITRRLSSRRAKEPGESIARAFARLGETIGRLIKR
jgi:predicted  nucleic acid-binding Zn-ribbon protein